MDEGGAGAQDDHLPGLAGLAARQLVAQRPGVVGRGLAGKVVVSGPPGAGKTTLAHVIAKEISCPAICRDEVKEGMAHGQPADFQGGLSPQFGIRSEVNMLTAPGKAWVTGPRQQELVRI